jgi:hypothetical protein
MRASKFSEADRIHFEAGGRRWAIAEVCCKARFSEATFYNWRKNPAAEAQT